MLTASALLVSLLTLIGPLAGSGVHGLAGEPSLIVARGSSHGSFPMPSAFSGRQAPPFTTAGPGVNVSVAPGTICAANWSSCPAATSTARVTLQMSGPPVAQAANYSSVQVLFLLETTPYDGAYDPTAGEPGSDACAQSAGGSLCEESSLLRTFVTNAGGIAAGIAKAHPGSEVTFGLADFFATLTSFDDGDGAIYHVDVGNFTAPAQFPKAVNDSLFNGTYAILQRPTMNYGDSDMSDNFLTVPSISALYLALFGSQLNWSPDAHHVLVQLGSAAPQDPHYPENYCVSPSNYRSFGPCMGQTCEPSITVGTLTSPACVGWTLSQTSDPNATIANYARSSPSCVNSSGFQCTIDEINVWDTPTDPYSSGWPTGTGHGGGPGGANVTADVSNILQAGCDIAWATGGTWDGPAWYSCNTTAGSLHYHNLTFNDTSLLSSLDNIGFGGPAPGFLAAGPGAPLLSVVTAPGVALAADPQFSATCAGDSGAASCPQSPSLSIDGAMTVLDWNWSSDPARNLLLTGARWTVGFNVVAATNDDGPTPVYLCDSPTCVVAGAGPSAGVSSVLSGTLSEGSAVTSWAVALPLAEVTVDAPSQPSVALTASSRIGEAPWTVSFNLTATGGVAPEVVLLDFGDGTSFSGVGTVPHTYSVGSFTASASVLDSRDQRGHATTSIEVLPPLSAWISVDTAIGPGPLTVSFSGNVQAGLAPYQYAWTFGDGNTSDLAAPQHTFTTPGTMSVNLTVTDALGYVQTSSAVVQVEPPQGSAPVGTPPGPSTHHPTGGSNATGEWTSLMTSAAIALVAAGVVAVGVALYVRRRRA